MKFSEVNGLTVEEIKLKLRNTKEELFQLKMKNILGQVGNPQSIRASRRTVARLMTALNQKISKK